MMLRRVGACLAFLSSILLVAALPGTAAAHDDGRAHRHGDFSVRLVPWEVPGGGDRGGYGFARITLDEAEERACYFIGWEELEGDVTAAHLHNAPRGHNGPHAIDFFNDRHFDGQRDGAFGCVRVTDDRHKRGMSAREKIRDIIDNPEDFSINIHTTRFKDGAIRGQLR
ncbi:MAG: CHRD domain-containing protein [Micromonosporaceae bacterium]